MQELLRRVAEAKTATIDEIPKFGFRVIIVLGKNVTGNPLVPTKPEKFKYDLSTESRLSAYAGAEVMRMNLGDYIITSTGQTITQIPISEARAQLNLMKKVCPSITDENSEAEEDSQTTKSNAVQVLSRVKKLKDKHPDIDITLVTIDSHTGRSLDDFTDEFRKEGVRINRVLNSYNVLVQIRPSYINPEFLEKYPASRRRKFELLKEAFLRPINRVKPAGKFIDRVAEMQRGKR